MSVRRPRVYLAGLLLAAVLSVGAGNFSAQGASAAAASHLRTAPTTTHLSKGPGAILPRTVTSNSIQPNVSAPSYTTSYYESSTSASTLQNQGCTAARGPSGVIVLDFGEPAYSGGVYGTDDFGGHFDSDNTLFHAVANFIYGAWNCHTSSTNIAVAVGTSNYGGWMGSYSTSAWYAAGQQWGDLVNNDQNYSSSNGYSNYIGVIGADDIEVEWAGYSQSSNFVNGYNNTSSHAFFDYGDDSGGANPSPWTAYEVWYVAWGAADDYPLPEIYYQADATSDWEQLAIWACNNGHGAMGFKGTMAEYPTGNYPSTAFDEMYNAEASNSCTAGGLSYLIFSTNI